VKDVASLNETRLKALGKGKKGKKGADEEA
jgi:hypothetical protein